MIRNASPPEQAQSLDVIYDISSTKPVVRRDSNENLGHHWILEIGFQSRHGLRPRGKIRYN